MVRTKTTTFHLSEVFGNLTDGGRETSEAVVRAIRVSPRKVFLKTIALTEHIDTNYINEFLSLPDYNVLTGYLRSVLAAVYAYIRKRLCPQSRRLLNSSLSGTILLESLHSVLLKGLVQHSMPRVLLKWARAMGNGDTESADFLNSSLRLALDCISRGDAVELRQHIGSVSRQIPGWATLQIPSLSGWTLLHYAASINGLTSDVLHALLAVLLENGVSSASVDYHGFTPLHTAAQYFSFNAMDALAKRGGRSARSTGGQLPLQLFLQQLAKVPSTVSIDYRLLVSTVKTLLPGDDPLLLLQSCSAHRYRSGLAYCLLHPDRELGHAILGLLPDCITASNAADAYPVLLDALVLCIRHKANSFYSALLQMLHCCQPIYQQQQPFRLNWEVFSVMVSTGLYWRNSTATYWAIDHIGKLLEFRQANAQSGDLFALTADHRHPIPWKASVYSAILQNDDRVLAALLKKFPIQFVFPLLSQQDGFLDNADSAFKLILTPEDGHSTDPSFAPAVPPFPARNSGDHAFDLYAFVRQDMRYLADYTWLKYMDQLSILNLASLLGHTGCVSVILKHLFINQSHLGDALLRSIHQQCILLTAIHGHLACLHSLRESLGMHRFAQYCFSPLGSLDLSLFEWTVVHLRRRLDNWIPNGDCAIVKAEQECGPFSWKRANSVHNEHCEATYRWSASITAYHQIFFFLLQHIHLVPNPHCRVTLLSTPEGDNGQVQGRMTERIAELMGGLKDRLLLSSLPDSDSSSCSLLVRFLCNRNANAARLLADMQRCQEKRSSLKEWVLSRNFALRSSLRKIVKAGSAWTPSAQWLNVGYILVALLDMLGNKFGAGYLPGQSQVQWSEVLRVIGKLIQSRETFQDTMQALLRIRPSTGTSSPPGLVLTREKWLVVDLMASDPSVKAVFKSPANSSSSKDSTGVRFNKELLRNNLFQGDESIALAFKAFSKLIDLIREEGRLWFGSMSTDRSNELLFPCEASPASEHRVLDHELAHKLEHSDWFRNIQATLSRESFLTSLNAVHELEDAQYCDYFLAQPNRKASLPALFMDKSLRLRPAHRAVDHLLITLGDYRLQCRLLGLVSNAENEVRIRNQREIRLPFPPTSSSVERFARGHEEDRSVSLELVDEILCQLIAHNHHLYLDISQQNVYLYRNLVRESLLPFLLPLLSWKCYSAVDRVLDAYSTTPSSSSPAPPSSSPGQSTNSDATSQLKAENASTAPATELSSRSRQQDDSTMPAQNTSDGYTMDYYFMSPLAHISLVDSRGYAAAMRSYQQLIASDSPLAMHTIHSKVVELLRPGDHADNGASWSVDDLFVLTPVHFFLADGQFSLLVKLLGIFPFLAVPLESLVSFVHELKLYRIALDYLLHLEDVHRSLLCPSLFTKLYRSRICQSRESLLFMTAIECILTSCQRYLCDYSTSNQGILYSSITSHFTAYAHKILRSHSKARLYEINLTRDMCILMMDGSYVFVSDVIGNVNNLLRAMPSTQHSDHYHLLHCLVHTLQTHNIYNDAMESFTTHTDWRVIDRKRRLTDLLDHVLRTQNVPPGSPSSPASSSLPVRTSLYVAQRAMMVDCQGYSPLALLLKHRFDHQAFVLIKELLAEVSLAVSEDVNSLIEQNNYHNAYNYLVQKYSSQPSTAMRRRPYLFDLDEIVIHKHRQLLEKLQASSCQGTDLRKVLPTQSPSSTLPGKLAARPFLSLDAVLHPPAYPQLAKKAALEYLQTIRLTDPMTLLQVSLQYAQYIYSLLVHHRGASSSSTTNSAVVSDNIASFLQYAMSGPYGKLDVFLRARQALSLLNIPTSVLCRSSVASGDVSGQEVPSSAASEGGFPPSHEWVFPAQDALKQCRQLSHSSYQQLQQVVTGFFRHRCNHPTSAAKGERAIRLQGSSSSVRLSSPKVKVSSALEDSLLAWHSPWLSCVALGSSGLSIDQFLHKYFPVTVVPAAVASTASVSASVSASVRGDTSLFGAKRPPRQTVYNASDPTRVVEQLESFDVLKVMQMELSSSMHVTPATQPALYSSPQGLAGSDAKGLATALDTAYLILDFARYLCLSRSLLLITQDMDTSSKQASFPSATQPWSSEGRQGRGLSLERRKRHPFIAQQELFAAVLAEHELLCRFVQSKTARSRAPESPRSGRPLSAQTEESTASEGFGQRLASLDGVTGEALRLFFRINPHYSARVCKLRKVLAQGLTALLLDLGQISLSELVCRLALQSPSSPHSNQAPSLSTPSLPASSQGGASPPRTKDQELSSSASGFSPRKVPPGARLSDASGSFDHLLAVLQRLKLSDFSHPARSSSSSSQLPTMSIVLKNRFQRFKKYFDTLSLSLGEQLEKTPPTTGEDRLQERKDWQNALLMLRDGHVLTPLSSEKLHLFTLFDSLQGTDPTLTEWEHLSRKDKLLEEAEQTLRSALLTGSRIYWLLHAVYGLLQRAEQPKEGRGRELSSVLAEAKALYDNGRANPLIACVLRPRQDPRNLSVILCTRYLLQLGCSATAAAVPHLSALSLVELLALRGEASFLRCLLQAYSPPNPPLSIQDLALGKHLIFHTLLAMPGAAPASSPSSNSSLVGHERDRRRRGYMDCVKLLLQHQFPVLSPCSAVLSCLDVAVLHQAWELLSELFQQSHVDCLHAALTTEERVDVKFSLHQVSMLGLACTHTSAMRTTPSPTMTRWDILWKLFQQATGRTLVGESLSFARQWSQSTAFATALQRQAALQTEVCRIEKWLESSSFSNSLSSDDSPQLTALREEAERLREDLWRELQAIVLPEGEGKDHLPAIPPSAREMYRLHCPIVRATTSSSLSALPEMENEPRDETKGAREDGTASLEASPSDLHSSPVHLIDLACRAGEVDLLRLLFEKSFPASLLEQAIEWAEQETAVLPPRQVLHLARLVSLCVLYARPSALTTLLGLLLEADEDSSRSSRLVQRVLRLALLDSSPLAAVGAAGAEVASGGCFLAAIVSCPHTATGLQCALANVPSSGVDDPAVQVFLDGVVQGTISEDHAAVLLRHAYDESDGSEETLAALTAHFLHYPAGLTAQGGRMLHIFCVRGWAKLVATWLECVGAEEMDALDDQGLTPWQVSVALGHAQVSRALQPFLPWTVRRAVSDVVYYLRLALLSKASRASTKTSTWRKRK